MSLASLLSAVQGIPTLPLIAVGVAVLAFLVFALLVIFVIYWNLWFQAFMCDAHVSLFSLVGMSLRQVDAKLIVRSKIMVTQRLGLPRYLPPGDWKPITWPAATFPKWCGR